MPHSPGDSAGLRGTTDRASYLIDRFRVGYEFGGGWTCGCREFVARDSCKHTREAAGRRAAQQRIADHLARRPPDELTFSMRGSKSEPPARLIC